MKPSAMVEWIQNEFLPLTLATPTPTITQIIDNTVRYWNTHSAFKTLEMVDYSAGNIVKVSSGIKQVWSVHPAQLSEWIMQNHPLWTLLGVTILDNVTSDLIQLASAYQHYRVYVGTDFHWTFAPNQDPTAQGDLYVQHVPNNSTGLMIVGSKRITVEEDVVSEHIVDWLLWYVKALVKKAEGNLLRKSDVIGVSNDGQQLYDEGAKEEEDLRERLFEESQWQAMAKRI